MSSSELEKKYADSNSKFMEIDGFRIHYKDEGSGKPLLLMHGIFASLHTWDSWTAYLKKHFRVIRLDLPVFGLTGAPSKDVKYTHNNYVDIVAKLLDKLKVNRCSIGGNSFGGYLAWNFAVKYPGRVDKLVLIDSAGFPGEPPLPVKLYTMPVIGYFATKISPRFVIEMNIKEVYGDDSKVTDRLVDRYYELLLKEGSRVEVRKLFTAIIEPFLNKNLSSGISKMKMPVLVMWGGADIWIPTEQNVRLWKKSLPRAKYIVYPGAGHTPMEEIPGKTVEDAYRFLVQ